MEISDIVSPVGMALRKSAAITVPPHPDISANGCPVAALSTILRTLGHRAEGRPGPM
jgi:hypothetical protein